MSRVLERLLNLLAFLRTVGRAVTIDEIRFTVAGYERDNDEAFRRMFERDKATLRKAGIPLETVVIDTLTNVLGYELPAERFEMEDPGLTDEELAALWLATRLVRMGGGDITPALHKLGGSAGDLSEVPAPTANLGEVEAVAAVFGAITERRMVAVTYHGRRRRLEPHGLLHRRGHWYVVAREGAEDRVFRIDRGDGWAGEGGPDAFDRPAGIDLRAALPDTPWEVGEQPIEAIVRFDDDIAWWVEHQLGVAPVEVGDGFVVARLPVANRHAFLGWLLDLGASAEVLGPPELRALVVERIRGVA